MGVKESARVIGETAYVITSSRLIVSNKSASRNDLQAKDLASLGEYTVEELGDGCGTVRLTGVSGMTAHLPSGRRKWKPDHDHFSLVMIRGPHEAHKMLTDAIRAAKSVSA